MRQRTENLHDSVTKGNEMIGNILYAKQLVMISAACFSRCILLEWYLCFTILPAK